MPCTVYLDHAATTPVAPEVLEAMAPYHAAVYGNPSSIHGFGRQAREAMEQARAKLAALLGAQEREIYFTSGGTEADNLAIFGTAYSTEQKGRHLITSAVEHHAVLHAVQALAKRGWTMTILPVDKTGLVDPEDVRKALRPDTVLVSIMHANNEVGTIQPIREIGVVCRNAGVLFHTDAVQTVGHIPTDVGELGVDMLSLSAHKFYGPKGAGALYVRKGIRLTPLLYGGGHERGLRSGTENVPGIVGMGRAAGLAISEMASGAIRQTGLRDRLLDEILKRIPECFITGHRSRRLPNNASLCVKCAAGEALLVKLDIAGIAASSGSACTSGSLDPSHVLLAMGIPADHVFGPLRFSLGRSTTEEDITYLLEQLPGLVNEVRALGRPHDEEGCNCLFCHQTEDSEQASHHSV